MGNTQNLSYLQYYKIEKRAGVLNQLSKRPLLQQEEVPTLHNQPSVYSIRLRGIMYLLGSIPKKEFAITKLAHSGTV